MQNLDEQNEQVVTRVEVEVVDQPPPKRTNGSGDGETIEIAPAEDRNQMPPTIEEQTRTMAEEKIIKLKPAKKGGKEKFVVRSSAFSDDALALYFSKLYKDQLRYVAEAGLWRKWNGSVWERDKMLYVFSQSRRFVRVIAEELARRDYHSLAKQIASRGTVSAIENFSRCDHRLVATVEQWDEGDWLLNSPDGIIDLITGHVLPHDPLAYCTKITPEFIGGSCPRWMKFLEEITAGDDGLQRYLQRVAGYCLTGSTRDHALFFLYGTGANGKGVFTTALTGILGEYATTAAMETFLASSQDRHPTELAKLSGARLVTASEISSGRYWSEAKVKLLTGGDKIAARFMRQDFFDYVPKFKLIIVGNYKPNLSNVDEAIRRRLHLIPFAVTIPEDEQDDELNDKLRREWPGMFRWAIEGCLEWQKQGLNPPEVVRSATEAYFDAENTLEQWIAERCQLGKDKSDSATGLYGSWCSFCREEGEIPGSQKLFSQNLIVRGFKQTRTSKKRGFIGISLLPPPEQGLRI